MTDKQKEAIKNMINKNLLDMFCNYLYKILTMIVDQETASVCYALRAEIMNRMLMGDLL